MFFVLSKALLFLLKPIVWIIGVLVFSLVSKNSRRQKRLLICGLVGLFIFSNEALINTIFYLYEPAKPEIKTYDIGLLLGGFSTENEETKEVLFNQHADRFLKTLSLYKTGVIKKIMITGGSENQLSEAEIAGKYLRELGIPDSVLLIEKRSRNTIENAAFSWDIISKKQPKAKVLVITSAWHIPRSRMIFSKHFGSQVDFYPASPWGKLTFTAGDFLMPSAEALNKWEFLMKEWIGLFVDRFRSVH